MYTILKRFEFYKSITFQGSEIFGVFYLLNKNTRLEKIKIFDKNHSFSIFHQDEWR